MFRVFPGVRDARAEREDRKAAGAGGFLVHLINSLFLSPDAP
jgi:hypothetical protein